MRIVTEKEKVDLEELIDRCGLSNVLGALSGICLEKANHIVASYSDKQTASHWVAAATDLCDLSNNKNYL